ncbi:RadC family protein [Niabella ginsengisoli]|uniref:DNA repair protein RadC n=1 Tax=Niabella ginsengisoli TaxID=522298 RepID=A0ABS9SFN8_9BACT|nr:DNA repair protein RadC [Niabella ginsengisoli]MCH5597167.1 DNA repair protein RadC [Niabella ginsengisoli]
MQPKNTIKQWAKDDRPRERLLTIGADNLSNSELLAILIHNGTKQKSAVDLAKEILRLGNDNLNELGTLSIKQLMKVKGIGEAKAITIAAALELGRRRQSGTMPDRNVLITSKEISGFLKERLKDYQHEVFAVVYLNRANKVISFDIISEGGITGTVADPRLILKSAIEKNAVSLILSHNHPSGSLKPSRADEYLTEKIKQAAGFLDIKVLDHVIVSDAGYYSFADDGLL